MITLINQYVARLQSVLNDVDWSPVEVLAEALIEAVENKRQVFLCGNGGSAGNAIHLANDFLYGIEPNGRALNVEALSANSAVLTCLGNDIGYDNIYAHQLKVKANAKDILIVLSGSGNSPNIVNALEQANTLNMQSFAILGYSGGKAKALAQYPIHFNIDDMQISEDTQMIVGHMLMQHLASVLKKGCE
ncbi:SIS domain-containing protein [Alteromonas sp. a30]|uniref:SIS domain-containing protein n=1 Tax=Alteromonas sp. a30 TaxID=2730917 RepID=UPI00227F7010|nr:SIS domain-containing protein [Alteromonas sp. a30]MCY7294514.1 SIS domain-containing protein [Alteromonas sp. a30]